MRAQGLRRRPPRGPPAMPRQTPASPAASAQPPRPSLRANRRPRVAALPRQSCPSRRSSQGGQPVLSKSNSSVSIVRRWSHAAGWLSDATSRLRVGVPAQLSCSKTPPRRAAGRMIRGRTRTGAEFTSRSSAGGCRLRPNGGDGRAVTVTQTLPRRRGGPTSLINGAAMPELASRPLDRGPDRSEATPCGDGVGRCNGNRVRRSAISARDQCRT